MYFAVSCIVTGQTEKAYKELRNRVACYHGHTKLRVFSRGYREINTTVTFTILTPPFLQNYGFFQKATVCENTNATRTDTVPQDRPSTPPFLQNYGFFQETTVCENTNPTAEKPSRKSLYARFDIRGAWHESSPTIQNHHGQLLRGITALRGRNHSFSVSMGDTCAMRCGPVVPQY